jgi:RsiW-degrading membrane proteinase PrsW (M82 family)
MPNVPLVIAIIINFTLPLIFLIIIKQLDPFAFAARRQLRLAVVWGFGAFGLAFVSLYVILNISIPYILIFRIIAPTAEEIIKMGILLYYARTGKLIYFVDGTTYGFAAGTGFAVAENLYFLTRSPGIEIPLILSRVLSTSLMHATTSALMGTMLGRCQASCGSEGTRSTQARRFLTLLVSFLGAAAIHIMFNWIVTSAETRKILFAALGIGIGGWLSMGILITRGLHAERRSIRHALETATFQSEMQAAQRLRMVDDILQPIREHYGPERAAQVDHVLVAQARYDLTEHALSQTSDPAEKIRLKREIERLEWELNEAKRDGGLYALVYIANVLPDTAESPIWRHIQEVLVGEANGDSMLERSIFSGAADEGQTLTMTVEEVSFDE